MHTLTITSSLLCCNTLLSERHNNTDSHAQLAQDLCHEVCMTPTLTADRIPDYLSKPIRSVAQYAWYKNNKVNHSFGGALKNGDVMYLCQRQKYNKSCTQQWQQ